LSDTAETEGMRHDHRCQTEACPNDFVIITLNVDTSETNYLCWGCNMAFQIRVIQLMEEQGLFTTVPASVSSSPPPPPGT
jgi:hypothetical protein